MVKGYAYVARPLPGENVSKQVRSVGPALILIVEKEAKMYCDHGYWEECRTSTVENPLIPIHKKGTDPPHYRINPKPINPKHLWTTESYVLV